MNNEHSHNTQKNISLAFFLNLLFSAIELVGGLLTNSISILSDALHDFGDALSLLIAVFCEKKAKNKPTEKYTFGYLRYSVLGAFITSIILVIGSVTILFNCIPKLMNPEPVNYDGMIVLSIFGIVINGIAAMRTSHTNNLNEKSVSLHMMEDLLGWIAVIIGSLIIKFTHLYIIDPILSIMITIYIVFHVARNIYEIGKLFLIVSPDSYSESKLKELLLKNSDIEDIHHIHAWSLDSENHFLTLHIKLKNDISLDKLHLIKHEIKECIYENFKINHTTIEFEFLNETCDDTNCKLNTDTENNNHHNHHSHHH